MFRQYADEMLVMVVVAFLLAIMDSVLFMIKVDKEKKDQFMKWFNILGIAIIIAIVFRELIKFFGEIQTFLYRL